MAVSKRTRFEVLRRDNYTCRYCRSTEGELTVDHVVPASLGGSDNPSNLVAACKDCNAGKASTSPDEAIVVDVSDDEIRWARALKQASERRIAELRRRQEVTDWFVSLWESSMPAFADLPEVAEVADTVGRFMGLGLAAEEIEHAVHSAAAASHVYQRARWKYWCGICWNKVRTLHDEARAIFTDEPAEEVSGE